MQKLPRARHANIVTQKLRDDLLLYDINADKAYCLNETLGKVFDACSEATTFNKLKSQSGLTDDLIFLALECLRKHDLLIDNYDSPLAGISRRQLVRRAGLASAVALPVISLVTAPAAADAASTQTCIPPNTPTILTTNCDPRAGQCIFEMCRSQCCSGTVRENINNNDGTITCTCT